MSKIKNELSNKNEYYISKYRFLELRNFCLQYQTWITALRNNDGYSSGCKHILADGKRSPTEDTVVRREHCQAKKQMVEQAAKYTDPELYSWILKGVTSEVPYEYLFTVNGIPCSRSTYYKRYRKFFWILDKLRD